MSFSPVQASLEGFRFIRDRPRSVTVWMLALFVLSLATAALAMSPWAVRLEQLRTATSIDWSWSTFRDLVIHLIPAILLSIFLNFAGLCIILPSILRMMLGKSERPVLRMGQDEARMFWIILAMQVLIILSLVPAGFLLFLSRSYGVPLADQIGLGFVMKWISSFLSLLISLYIILRTVFAVPIAIDQHRLTVAGSWRLTRHASGPLILTALISLILVLLVQAFTTVTFYLIGVLVTFVLGLSLEQFEAFLKPDSSVVMAQFGPGPLIVKLMTAAQLTIAFCVACGGLVYAYRDMSAKNVAEAQPEDDILEHETVV